MSRAESTHFRDRVKAVAQELKEGKLQIEPGKEKLLRTREEVRRGWLAVSDELTRQGHLEIAAQVKRHVEQMPRPLTEKEYIATKLLGARSQTAGSRNRNGALRIPALGAVLFHYGIAGRVYPIRGLIEHCIK